MKQLLSIPCTRQWVLSDIIYIYKLEPTSTDKVRAGQLIQKAASRVASGKLLNVALKRAVAANLLLLVGSYVLASGLCYAINRYKEINEKKKAAALAQKQDHPAQSLITTAQPQFKNFVEEVAFSEV